MIMGAIAARAEAAAGSVSWSGSQLVQDLLAVFGQLGFAYAVDRRQCRQGGGTLGGDLAQGCVVEDHIGWEALLPRDRRAPGAQPLEQVPGLGGEFRGGAVAAGRVAEGGCARPGGLGGPLGFAAKRDLAALAENLGAGRGQDQGAVLGFDGQQTFGQELADDAAPFWFAEFGADAEDLESVVAVLGDLGSLLAQQDVDDLACAELLVAFVAEAVNGGQQFLGGDGAVPGLRWGQAGVAVVTRRRLLAEVGE